MNYAELSYFFINRDLQYMKSDFIACVNSKDSIQPLHPQSGQFPVLHIYALCILENLKVLGRLSVVHVSIICSCVRSLFM